MHEQSAQVFVEMGNAFNKREVLNVFVAHTVGAAVCQAVPLPSATRSISS